jgi:DNA-binding LacI/PurR family transcriptional regulator
MKDSEDKTKNLVRLVLKAIMEGKYGAGDTIPSEREMARQIGISRVTVRRAYAQLEKASILKRQQGHGTAIATGARGCTEDIRYIGMLTAWGPFGMSFLRALEAGASSSDALLVIRVTDGRREQEEAAAMDLVAKGIRNLVIWLHASDYRQTTYERLRVVGANMVFFDRVRPRDIADFVGMDNRKAIRSLIEQGLKDGCESFDFVGYGNSHADSELERLDAFRSLCSERGVRYVCHEVPYGRGTEKSLRKAQMEGLGAGQRPGVVCVHDALALQVRSVLGETPRLYSIDGTPAAVAAGITTVEQPLAQMAKVALQMLKEQQTKGADWRAREVRIDGRLRLGRAGAQEDQKAIHHETEGAPTVA